MKMLPVVLLLSWLGVFAQSKALVEKKGGAPLLADAFTGYDNFGNLYYSKDNVFYKRVEGTTLEYKAVALGKLRRADIRNPLQIVLFYEDFNTVVLLDNQLNETQRIDFSQNKTPLVATAAGMSGQNRLWVFNSLTQRVGLYDYVTQELREITVPVSGKLLFHQSDFNYFYWIAADGMLRRTDIFGKVSELAQINAFQQFALGDNGNAFVSDASGKALLLNLRDGKSFPIEIDEKTYLSLQYHGQILSIFTGTGISNYKISVP